MLLEKIFGRLRRTNHPINHQQDGEGSPMRSLGTIMTTTSLVGNGATRSASSRFFERSNTVILDDGPASLQEVVVRKLDDDKDDNWLLTGNNAVDGGEEEVGGGPSKSQQGDACPPSPGVPPRIQPRRVDRARYGICIVYSACVRSPELNFQYPSLSVSNTFDCFVCLFFICCALRYRLEEWDAA